MLRFLRLCLENDYEDEALATLDRPPPIDTVFLMPIYIYETVPASESERSERFEIKQSMNDAPLTQHPETGQPVRRVITGGYGFSVGGASAPPSSGHSCGAGSCGCHN